MEEDEQNLITPIINASYPGTLAALSLAILQVTGLSGQQTPFSLKIVLLLGATAFLLSAFSIFFYSIYSTKKWLWTITAMSFIAGLMGSTVSVVLLFVI